MIRAAVYSDAWAIAEIYNYYVSNTTLTFESECVSPYKIAEGIERCKHAGYYLVYEQSKVIVGYACISGFRGTTPDAHLVESTIYLKNSFGGRGIGFQLYSELLSKTMCNHEMIIAGISRANLPSIRLHEKCGFKKVSHFSESGRKFGEWIDVGFWQKVGN